MWYFGTFINILSLELLCLWLKHISWTETEDLTKASLSIETVLVQRSEQFKNVINYYLDWSNVTECH